MCSNERLNNIELSSDNLMKCDITCISVSVLLFRRVEFPVGVRVRVRVRVSMEKIAKCNNSSGNYTLV